MNIKCSSISDWISNLGISTPPWPAEGEGWGYSYPQQQGWLSTPCKCLKSRFGSSYTGAYSCQSSSNWMRRFCAFYYRWIISGRIRPAQQLRAWDLEPDCLEATPVSPHTASGTGDKLPKRLPQFPYLSHVTEMSICHIRLLWELPYKIVGLFVSALWVLVNKI